MSDLELFRCCRHCEHSPGEVHDVPCIRCDYDWQVIR